MEESKLRGWKEKSIRESHFPLCSFLSITLFLLCGKYVKVRITTLLLFWIRHKFISILSPIWHDVWYRTQISFVMLFLYYIKQLLLPQIYKCVYTLFCIDIALSFCTISFYNFFILLNYILYLVFTCHIVFNTSTHMKIFLFTFYFFFFCIYLCLLPFLVQTMSLFWQIHHVIFHDEKMPFHVSFFQDVYWIK